MGFFPLAASRGASRITMDVALPALIFANVIPAFNPSNISALGPLFLTAFTYQAIGFVFGWAIREICYVPQLLARHCCPHRHEQLGKFACVHTVLFSSRSSCLF